MLPLAVLLLTRSVWERKRCGCALGQADIVTKWGRTVNASSPPLPEYPRPQMVRSLSWHSLNGMWQWESAEETTPTPFGRNLKRSILVPFPPESCLSGIAENHQRMFYRLVFDSPVDSNGAATLLHFGAVDWKSSVYFNGQLIGNHTGGYDGFSFSVQLKPAGSNELIVSVFDPSELGAQPFGKQRAAAIMKPGAGGNRYTPTSGIWQTVWLEVVPAAAYINSLQISPRIDASSTDDAQVELTVQVSGAQTQVAENRNAFTVQADVVVNGKVVSTASGESSQLLQVPVPPPVRLWSPDSPFLYNLTIRLLNGATVVDMVKSYVGMRSISLQDVTMRGTSGSPAVPTTPGLNYPGHDLPGSPHTLPSPPSAAKCEALCNRTSDCAAYAYGVTGVPGCSHAGMCWLKGAAALAGKVQHNNTCRVAGAKATPGSGEQRVKALFLNGRQWFASGWLDQSWWPDGQYTAPTDEALAFDVRAAKTFGLNMVRLHQKINPERWYYWADRVGLAVMQDAVQHFEYPKDNGSKISPVLFTKDWQVAIRGRGNHPSIVQWNIFNEFEYEVVSQNRVLPWASFWQPSDAILNLTREIAGGRPVDFNSGGPGNKLHIGDVNDVHDYPQPGQPQPSATQYAMVGEYGGIGWNPTGHEWYENQCHRRQITADNSTQGADVYVAMLGEILKSKQSNSLSAAVYTQVTDVEVECDGLFAYDRTPHFNAGDVKRIFEANRKLTAET